VIFRGFPLLFFSIWKLCYFVIWLGVGTNLCYWLRLFCTLVDHSEAISLVLMTRGFYPWFEGFSTLKILVPLFVFLVIYYCCSLIIDPHRFLQVRGNYIRCILWYIVCVIVFPIRVASELLVGLYLLAWMMEANAKMVALNGTNYHFWKGKMKDLLFVKKLHLPVFTTQKPDSVWRRMGLWAPTGMWFYSAICWR